MKIEFEINNNDLESIVADKIVAQVRSEFWGSLVESAYRKEIVAAVVKELYKDKEHMISAAVERASRELVKKGFAQLMDEAVHSTETG